MCGTTMVIVVREVRDFVPGAGLASPRTQREWNCPECDYFEEAEAGEE